MGVNGAFAGPRVAPGTARSCSSPGRSSDDHMASTPEGLAGDILGELADYISDFVWVREADSGTILYLNDVWERITGQHVPVGAHYTDFFRSTHPEDVYQGDARGPDCESGWLRSAAEGHRQNRRRAMDARPHLSHSQLGGRVVARGRRRRRRHGVEAHRRSASEQRAAVAIAARIFVRPHHADRR